MKCVQKNGRDGYGLDRCINVGCVPNLIGNNKVTLIDKAKTVGLVINEESKKVMMLLENDVEVFKVERLVFEKVDQYKYFEAIIKKYSD